MPASKRKASDHPTVTVYKRAHRASPPSRLPITSLVQLRASKLQQEDQLVIDSVEGKNRNQQIGFDHYVHLLEQQPQTEPIRETSLMDESSDKDLGTYTNEQVTDEPAHGRSPSLNINSDAPPIPRCSYLQPMFAATTWNPAVFLAITRVAQRNLSFLNFDSVLNHLPNHPATMALPSLKHGVFVDDTKHTKRKGDDEMQVLFLPQYYTDDRHALGYFAISKDRYGKHVSTCLFTPCTNQDLAAYTLIDFLDDRRMNAGIGEEPEWTTTVKAVGARNGRWLDCDVVEDWDEWTLGMKIVSNIWKTRFDLTTGAGEGGDRWKPLSY